MPVKLLVPLDQERVMAVINELIKRSKTPGVNPGNLTSLANFDAGRQAGLKDAVTLIYEKLLEHQ